MNQKRLVFGEEHFRIVQGQDQVILPIPYANVFNVALGSQGTVMIKLINASDPTTYHASKLPRENKGTNGWDYRVDYGYSVVPEKILSKLMQRIATRATLETSYKPTLKTQTSSGENPGSCGHPIAAPIPPNPSRHQCPECGNTELHVMNAGETRTFYGYDRFVLYLPRSCLACGHAFEVHPGLLGCYFLTGFSMLGALFGLWLLLLGPFIGYAMFFSQRPMEANPRLVFGMVVVPILGALTLWRFSKETLRYWRLRKGRDGRPTPG